MANVLFRAKESAGRVAIWEKPASGDRLAPFDDPLAHFDLIRFCSDFQYLSVTEAAEVEVNHTLLAGATGTGYSVSNGTDSTNSSAAITNGQTRVTTINLLEHGLPYVPQFAVVHDGRLVTAGFVAQQATGQVRMVSAFANSTHICLREVAISSSADLPAVELDYDVLVFAEPTADPTKPFLRIKPDTEICLGWGKVLDSHRALRRAASGDATFYVPISRTVDIRNGAIRNISPIVGAQDYGTYIGGFFEVNAIEVTY